MKRISTLLITALVSTTTLSAPAAADDMPRWIKQLLQPALSGQRGSRSEMRSYRYGRDDDDDDDGRGRGRDDDDDDRGDRDDDDD